MNIDMVQEPKAPVHLVGQKLFDVVGWQAAIVIKCNCSIPAPSVMLSSLAGIGCPSCRRVYHIDKVVYERRGLNLNVELGIDESAMNKLIK